MKLKNILLLLFIQISLITAQTDYYNEPYRPQFHFSPEAHWMNDPNGLVYFNGKYHLYYQHYPEDIVWGPMHWGHAMSTDLLHWQHLPIALYPDSLGYIFSGSAVIDKDNTAGFGGNAMIAVFTYHDENFREKRLLNKESQGIAYSTDEGMTWYKYRDNPVVDNPGLQDFRDPKAFWNDDISKWNLVLAAGDRLKIYSSTDLKHWEYESDFKPADDFKGLGVWECPDLFKMPAYSGDKWVLIVNHGDKTPNGGSGTRYFIGNFDGKVFTNDQPSLWLDYGTDTYAGVTYSNAPDDQRIFIGWMSNWQYAQEVPTNKWRSAMALPRELILDEDHTGYFLRQEIVDSFDTLRTNILETDVTVLPYTNNDIDLSQEEVLFECDADELVVVVTNDIGEELKMELDNDKFYIDRRKSGKVDFSDKFAAKVQVMALDKDIYNYQIILDRASVEVLLNDGRYSMTNIFFPNEKYSNLSISSADADHLDNLEINKIHRVWK